MIAVGVAVRAGSEMQVEVRGQMATNDVAADPRKEGSGSLVGDEDAVVGEVVVGGKVAVGCVCVCGCVRVRW